MEIVTCIIVVLLTLSCCTISVALHRFVNDPVQRAICRKRKTRTECLKQDSKCAWNTWQNMCNEWGHQPLPQAIQMPANIPRQISNFADVPMQSAICRKRKTRTECLKHDSKCSWSSYHNMCNEREDQPRQRPIFANDPVQRAICRKRKTETECLKHDSKCSWDDFQMACNEYGHQPLIQHINQVVLLHESKPASPESKPASPESKPPRVKQISRQRPIFANDPVQRAICRKRKTETECLKHDSKCSWDDFQMACNEYGHQPLIQHINQVVLLHESKPPSPQTTTPSHRQEGPSLAQDYSQIVVLEAWDQISIESNRPNLQCGLNLENNQHPSFV